MRFRWIEDPSHRLLPQAAMASGTLAKLGQGHVLPVEVENHADLGGVAWTRL